MAANQPGKEDRLSKYVYTRLSAESTPGLSMTWIRAGKYGNSLKSISDRQGLKKAEVIHFDDFRFSNHKSDLFKFQRSLSSDLYYTTVVDVSVAISSILSSIHFRDL